jgi:hypothetical protein
MAPAAAANTDNMMMTRQKYAASKTTQPGPRRFPKKVR